MLLKKIMTMSIAGALLLSGGIASAANASATQGTAGASTGSAQNHATAKAKKDEVLKKLQAQAVKLGIDPKDKTAKQLTAAIQAKKKAEAAKLELKKLQNEAAKLKIDPNGKSAAELKAAIKAKHNETAPETGKTTKK
ncbi:hypothetical protein [Paenibacillus sp. FSL H7-0331]|jgi:hypothetical protein|uniref:hypothetical protein n=2 Tax=Paenibacillus sp. FSL H7-0331 TaxID=1920421 RepID=UPI00096E66F0|nr:hypothetical protein [Paenibacillus sp. FSL H7-0331]OMF18207.1 hypothetical protein BK127_10500 [Paenibacillus sp. FSL H7-0331]